MGRIAAVLDKAYNRFHGEEAGFFGFYESVDDGAVAKALLDRAWQWLQQRGAKVMRGPVNPSTNYECGMLIDGFDSDPMVMMPYNPRYYPELMNEAGLRKAKDLYAYGSSVAGVGTEKSERVAEKAMAAAGVVVRPIDMKNFNADVERVWQVYNSAWERNWGFVPMTREEFAADGQGNEADSEAGAGVDRRGAVAHGRVCAGVAGRQPGAEAGGGQAIPHGFS